jgi:hypothetical protein
MRRHNPRDITLRSAVRVCDNAEVHKTITKVETRPIISDGEGDHDRFAHYVRKADIVRSNVEGVPVVALCGKKWIPNRDPERYPVCPTCKEIMARLRGESS